MIISFDYYDLPKNDAIRLVRETIVSNNITISNETEIQYGYRFSIINPHNKLKSGIIVYFKEDISSRIVIDGSTSGLETLFSIDKSPLKTIPINATISISESKFHDIKKELCLYYKEDIKENLSTNDTVIAVLSINKLGNKFTLTLYNTGRLSLQGASSPVFKEVIDIIGKITPLNNIEKTLLFVPDEDKFSVQTVAKKNPNVFEELDKNARELVSEDVFEFLYPNDQNELKTAIGILNLIKRSDLQLPMYNPILYPFSKVFEGFIIRLMIEKEFFTFEELQQKPDIADIGNALRKRKFEKYIKDPRRHQNVLNKLIFAWEDLRCHELHSDPAQDTQIIDSKNISQIEIKIHTIAGVMTEAYRVLVENGYTEKEYLEINGKKEVAAQLNENNETSAPSDLLPSAVSQSDVLHSKTTEKKKAVQLNKNYDDMLSELPPNLFADVRIGTDESGKGDYFGPLVIAGVCIDSISEMKLKTIGVKDSKKNTDKKNRDLAKEIIHIVGRENYKIVIISPKRYNELYSEIGNLNRLLAWGHARAIEDILLRIPCSSAIADQFGDKSYLEKALMDQGKKIDLLQIPKGERDIAVAAASILARNAYLVHLNELETKAGMALPKGASFEVVNAAKKLVSMNGPKILNDYSKIHFKTTKTVLED